MRKAEKSFRKAFYFNPDYIEAYILRGNIYLEQGQRFVEGLHDDFERYRKRAKESYLKVQSVANIDEETKGMAHYKLGETYYDFYGNKEKASKQWKMAVSVSPESLWGKMAQERLNALK